MSPEPAPPSGSVWVADEGGDSLTVLDASTNAVTTTVRGLKKTAQRPGGSRQCDGVRGQQQQQLGGGDRRSDLHRGSCRLHWTSSRACDRRPPQRQGLCHQHRRRHRVGVPDPPGAPAGGPDQPRRDAAWTTPPRRRGLGDRGRQHHAGALDLIDPPAADTFLGAVPVGTGPAQVAVTADGRYATQESPPPLHRW